jgi:hypothetical protein
MIQIHTDGPIGVKFEAWLAKARKAREEMIEEYREKGEAPDPNRYQKVWKELKDLFLIEIFHNKCAFCEASLSTANFAAHVEHYRPKSGVTVGRAKIEHTGYFWLACEWYNLLLVCQNCNGGHSDVVSHPGKAIEFPVDGPRICQPSDDPAEWRNELESEEPLLLHPYFDHPEDHIAFSRLGVPYAKDDSKRGRATIETCHLDRENLCSARRETAESVFLRRLYRHGETLRATTPRSEPVSEDRFREEDPFSAWLQCSAPWMMKELMTRMGIATLPAETASSGTSS